MKCGQCKGDEVLVSLGRDIGTYYYCKACKLEEKEWRAKSADYPPGFNKTFKSDLSEDAQKRLLDAAMQATDEDYYPWDQGMDLRLPPPDTFLAAHVTVAGCSFWRIEQSTPNSLVVTYDPVFPV